MGHFATSSNFHLSKTTDKFLNFPAFKYATENRAAFISLSAVIKGLAKLGNIVADVNASQFSRAGNMCCSETKNVLAGVKNMFASRTQILRPKHMFRSLVSV